MSARTAEGSGIGTSTLARRFVAELRAEHPNCVILSGRCYERESVSYKAFDGIVDALSEFLNGLEPSEAARLLPENAALLARIFPVLRRVAAIESSPSPPALSPPDLRVQAFAALRALLAAIADERPLVLYVNELRWADADSRLLFNDLLDPSVAPVCASSARPVTIRSKIGQTCGAWSSTR